LNHECHLDRRRVGRRFVSRDADEARRLGIHGDERQALPIVDVGQVMGPVRWQARHDREEPLVRALLTQPLVERKQERPLINAALAPQPSRRCPSAAAGRVIQLPGKSSIAAVDVRHWRCRIGCAPLRRTR
jgi:hypothetical protein